MNPEGSVSARGVPRRAMGPLGEPRPLTGAEVRLWKERLARWVPTPAEREYCQRFAVALRSAIATLTEKAGRHR